MKILVLGGSPNRKGSTQPPIHRFLRGAGALLPRPRHDKTQP